MYWFLIVVIFRELVSSYVYLDDLVQAIKQGIDKEVRNETFNIAFKEPVTLTTLLLEISHVLDSVFFHFYNLNAFL